MAREKRFDLIDRNNDVALMSALKSLGGVASVGMLCTRLKFSDEESVRKAIRRSKAVRYRSDGLVVAR